MRLTKDALRGLGNKKKRDRLVLDLIDQPTVMDNLDPANLVEFDEYLEMRTRDQIGVNDIAGVIFLHRRQYERAVEVSRDSLTLTDISQDPHWAMFAKMIIQTAEDRQDFSFVENVFHKAQTEIVFYHGESLLEPCTTD